MGGDFVNYREATEADIPRLVEMGRHFLAASSYREHLADNAEKMKETIATFIGNDLRKVIVCENGQGVSGMLAFFVYAHPLSGELLADELVWWVEPEARGAGIELLKRVEAMARSMGATKMQMVTPDERLGKLYERRGYHKIEVHYLKEFGGEVG
jgi:GNAT superfamily N-acetyltransferase